VGSEVERCWWGPIDGIANDTTNSAISDAPVSIAVLCERPDEAVTACVWDYFAGKITTWGSFFGFASERVAVLAETIIVVLAETP
jgi:hypothetical protein